MAATSVPESPQALVTLPQQPHVSSNQVHLFNGVPSPEAMHTHVVHKKELKRYFSRTTLAPPSMPWSPLPTNKQMETRTCFHTGSRIHVLACGHMIAVPRDAEMCAANCAPAMTNIPPSLFLHHGASVPTPYASMFIRIQGSALKAVDMFLKDSANKHAAAFATAQRGIMEHTRALRSCPDLVSGDFSCQLCNTTAHRPTFPAVYISQHPYHCIVVGRDHHDLAVIQQVLRGVHPRAPSSVTNNFGCAGMRKDEDKGKAGKDGQASSQAQHHLENAVKEEDAQAV